MYRPQPKPSEQAARQFAREQYARDRQWAEEWAEIAAELVECWRELIRVCDVFALRMGLPIGVDDDDEPPTAHVGPA